jgi:hypothetical protein
MIGPNIAACHKEFSHIREQNKNNAQILVFFFPAEPLCIIDLTHVQKHWSRQKEAKNSFENI